MLQISKIRFHDFWESKGPLLNDTKYHSYNQNEIMSTTFMFFF